MKVGLISDVHGNRVALEAVLEDMPPVDELVCAGDVVGYNPWPAACVDELRERAVPTVMGNHDAAVAAETPFRFNGMARAGVEYAETQLSADQLRWLAELPTERVEFDGRLKVVHGHPDDPDRYTRYTYPEEFSPRLLDEEDVLVLGHTHVQGVERYTEGIVVNPGSVGQPRDGDPRAGYAVVDLEAMTVETHRVEYDVEGVQEAVREAGLPERIGRRLARGK
ncbi:YfcE family phosphodiesterase [Halobiforma lacisalsi AJ5]|uniref:Phosphoesterase n=1 Tax=Natronobacterium lacisalsi AJ5 TaxID=358396 RepID=M0LMN0_NATLA|nr:metallophosphoesterase family protein [Halobiforma lacisalsi]APW97044.1 YfcE family phosphodiesterase [Halobiforma lacisalsi AJ5]EMA34761.1 phosphodiesterase [Halobiforma lacisalsi AJ5]